ncbi:hypothetical protein FKM82_019219 [Ascaphus truei]
MLSWSSHIDTDSRITHSLAKLSSFIQTIAGSGALILHSHSGANLPFNCYTDCSLGSSPHLSTNRPARVQNNQRRITPNLYMTGLTIPPFEEIMATSPQSQVPPSIPP